MASRAAFLHDPTHRVVVYDTPKHACLYEKGSKSGARHLVRTLLKRGNFTSLENLRDQILACIDSSNRTMAKPTKWTYRGIV